MEIQKRIQVQTNKLLKVFPPILHNEPWVRQRVDPFEQTKLLVQVPHEPQVLPFPKTDTIRGMAADGMLPDQCGLDERPDSGVVIEFPEIGFQDGIDTRLPVRIHNRYSIGQGRINLQ